MDQAQVLEFVAWWRAQPLVVQALVLLGPSALVVLIVFGTLGFPLFPELLIPWRVRLALWVWRRHAPEQTPEWVRRLRLNWGDVRPDPTPDWAERAQDALDAEIARRGAGRRFE